MPRMQPPPAHSQTHHHSPLTLAVYPTSPCSDIARLSNPSTHPSLLTGNKPPPEPTQQWPPRSPHEAMVSTPEGRKKFRKLVQQSPTRSPSQISSPSRRLLFGSPSRPLSNNYNSALSPTRPSPAQRAMSDLSASGTRGGRVARDIGGDVDMFDDDDGVGDDLFLGLGNDQEVGEEDEDEDEDEETLRLKLEAIQAKLKLKKLMNAKKKFAGGEGNATPSSIYRTGTPGPGVARSAATATGVNVFGGGLQDAATIARRPGSCSTSTGLERSKFMRQARSKDEEKEHVEVPASPANDNRREPPSGFGGHHYHRAHSPIRPQSSFSSATAAAAGGGGGGHRAGMDSRASTNTSTSTFQPQQKYLDRRSHTPSTSETSAPTHPKQTFVERLSAARRDEDVAREKDRLIKAARTDSFTISEGEMEEYKSKAVGIPQSSTPQEPAAKEFSRAEILSGKAPKSKESEEDGGDSLEPYSGMHLAKRIIPHQTLTRTLSSKKILLLQDLLRDVRAPDFSLPDVEMDLVVLAVVAKKSDPKNHKPQKSDDNNNASSTTASVNKQKNGDSERGKFMILTLSDLTYEIDLFLFDSGFSRFWKLPTGTLVAILNPNVMPPPPGKADTGRFSLVINSDADNILEVGTARDLGYCGAKRRDGQMCSSWVNLRRTEYCEFHVNEAVKRKRAGRMEVNSMDGWSSSTLLGGGRRGGGGKGNWLDEREREKYKPGGGAEGHKKGGPKDYDRETQTRYYVAKMTGMGASGMLDAEASGFRDRKEREEILKRRLVREEKEREVAKKLAKMGGKAGSEYMGVGSKTNAEGSEATKASGLDKSGLLKGGRGTGQRRGTPSSSATTLVGSGSGTQAPAQTEQAPPSRSVRDMGLIPAQGGTDLTLKRKRPVDITTASSSTATSTATSRPSTTTTSSSSSTTTGSSTGGKKGTALGWGSNLKGKLSRMKDGEALLPQPQGLVKGQQTMPQALSLAQARATTQREGEGGQDGPVRKKTRFLTDAGIKEAGRDSFGGPSLAAVATAKGRKGVVAEQEEEDDDSSDDDLVII
ncbi:hypothetical protein MKZ38_004295 [Zalerion maritima]|uniref:Zinc finger Mcm10/DnaG-type domain-containing protein n=1 Tax=Zalerion maritima TaxID=339359 RepID=A0AAD5WR56_9PEZI|nr:hypothetical protein MKZ38_004295 [Zalerion maritima]